MNGDEQDIQEEYAAELAELSRRGLYFQGVGQGPEVRSTEEQMAAALDAEISKVANGLHDYLEAYRAWQIDKGYHRLLVRIAEDSSHPSSGWAKTELKAFDKTNRYDTPLRRGRGLEMDEETAGRITKLQSLLEIRDEMKASSDQGDPSVER